MDAHLNCLYYLYNICECMKSNLFCGKLKMDRDDELLQGLILCPPVILVLLSNTYTILTRSPFFFWFWCAIFQTLVPKERRRGQERY